MNPFADEPSTDDAVVNDAPKNEGLTDDHIRQMIRILDACAQRGVFKCDEYVTVGALHQFLVNCIKQNE